VHEIHVMEVEFLSNMRYSLLATKEQWDDWMKKLGRFYEYYNRAQRSPVSPVANPSPSHKAFGSPLPSPTGNIPSHHHLLPTTPSAAIFSPSHSVQANGQIWPQYHPVGAAILSSPLSAKPNGMVAAGQKRRSDDDPTEPPPKRPAYRLMNMVPATMSSTGVTRPAVVDPLRLPVPSLTLNTNTDPSVRSVAAAYATQSLGSLPPLVPGVRAMATVFSAAPVTMAQQLPMPATAGPVLVPSGSYSTGGTHPNMGYGTPPAKRHSPGTMSGYVSSPMAEGFPPSALHTPIAHTPISHSPSVYLQQRPSPYRPIRNVNTLLYPPPSASLQDYHLTVPPPQMHYQPLGRRNDLRTGIVPEFAALPSMRFNQPGTPRQGHYPS
jgi:hypothetical protein